MDVREEISEEFDISSRCDILMSSDHSLVGGFLHLSKHPLDIWGATDYGIVGPEKSFRSGVRLRQGEENRECMRRRRHNRSFADGSELYREKDNRLTTTGPKIVTQGLTSDNRSQYVPEWPELCPLLDFHWPWSWNYATEWNRQTLLAKQLEGLIVRQKHKDTQREKIEKMPKKFTSKKTDHEIPSNRRRMEHGENYGELKNKEFPRPESLDPVNSCRRRFYSLEETRRHRTSSACKISVKTERRQHFFPEMQLQDGSCKAYWRAPRDVRTDIRCTKPTGQRTERRAVAKIRDEPTKVNLKTIKDWKQLLTRAGSSSKSTLKATLFKHNSLNNIIYNISRNPVKVRRIQVQGIQDQNNEKKMTSFPQRSTQATKESLFTWTDLMIMS